MTDSCWISDQLPPVEEIERRSEPDYYGASWLLARQLGRSTPPRSFATWSHAWQVEPTTDARQILSVGDDARHLVATEKHCELLRRAGHENVAAVGLPFLYADDVDVERKAGSLLVMPAHTLNYADYDWDQDEYVERISKLRHHFSCVVACVQSNCVQNGYWTEAFAKRGIPWIHGASTVDANALERMMILMKSFEFMTTNRMASHVPYAAYAGCKVSLYGTYVEPRTEHYIRQPFYQKHPDVLRRNIHRSSELEIRLRYGDFFTPPHCAVERRAWARETLGARYRRHPQEIACLLGWTSWQQVVGKTQLAAAYSRRRVNRLLRSVTKRLPTVGNRRRAA